VSPSFRSAGLRGRDLGPAIVQCHSRRSFDAASAAPAMSGAAAEVRQAFGLSR